MCCASSALPGFDAEYSSPYSNGRPGTNPLRVLTELDGAGNQGLAAWLEFFLRYAVADGSKDK